MRSIILAACLMATVALVACLEHDVVGSCPSGYPYASGDYCLATPPDGSTDGNFQGDLGDMQPLDMLMIACHTAADCPAGAPICGLQQTCVGCTNPGASNECAANHPSTPFCGPGGNCVQCVSKDNCDAVHQTCNAMGVCAPCQTNLDCTSGLCMAGACADKSTLLYVNNSPTAGCSDTGSGAFNAPFCTVQHGFAIAAATGKTLIVFAGNYGESVVAQPGASAYAVQAVGVGVPGPAITSLKLQTSGGQQLTVSLDNFVIQNATGASGDGVLCSGQGGATALTKLTLVRSLVQSNAQLGISASSCDVTMDADMIATNTQGGVTLSSSDFTLTNLLVYNNGQLDPGGSTVGGLSTTGAGSSARAQIVNCTFVANKNSAAGFTPSGAACGGSTVFFNNAIVGNAGVAMQTGGCAPQFSAYAGGSGSNKDATLCSTANLFVSPSANDYHPNKTAQSPCSFVLVDSGGKTSGGVNPPDHDLEGTSRPQPPGGSFDIGCYEAK